MAHVYAETYADRVRSGFQKLRLEGSHEPVTPSELALLLGYSYEHCRKVLSGQPVVSKEFNRRAAEVLRLDEAELWQIAQREKAAARLGETAVSSVVNLWERLQPSDQRLVVRTMKGLIALRMSDFLHETPEFDGPPGHS